jgi:hypothetical protein
MELVRHTLPARLNEIQSFGRASPPAKKRDRLSENRGGAAIRYFKVPLGERI